jgi:hypothetical protein
MIEVGKIAPFGGHHRKNTTAHRLCCPVCKSRCVPGEAYATHMRGHKRERLTLVRQWDDDDSDE